jgi:hypothetical protein
MKNIPEYKLKLVLFYNDDKKCLISKIKELILFFNQDKMIRLYQKRLHCIDLSVKVTYFILNYETFQLYSIVICLFYIFVYDYLIINLIWSSNTKPCIMVGHHQTSVYFVFLTLLILPFTFCLAVHYSFI